MANFYWMLARLEPARAVSGQKFFFGGNGESAGEKS